MQRFFLLSDVLYYVRPVDFPLRGGVVLWAIITFSLAVAIGLCCVWIEAMLRKPLSLKLCVHLWHLIIDVPHRVAAR